ncbi:MAG: DUF1016 N-terminal domain-containing protein [Flavobacteriales bacterium]
MSIKNTHTKLVNEIKTILQNARNKAVNAVNSAMVFAYWEIGKRIVEEEQNGKERAGYATYLLTTLAENLSRDLGKNFDARELRRIRQFYLCFSIRDTVRPELSWSHYRLLIRIESKEVRQYYLEEAVQQHWSTRKLDRNISTQYYQRIIANQIEKQNVKNKENINTLNFIKNPYVLEFLNLPAHIAHKEKEALC